MGIFNCSFPDLVLEPKYNASRLPRDYVYIISLLSISYLFENSFFFPERAVITGEYVSNMQSELYLSISKLIIGLLQAHSFPYGTYESIKAP